MPEHVYIARALLPSLFALDFSTFFNMGRIRQMIAVNGRKCWMLFDSGTPNTYAIPSVAHLFKTSPTPQSIRTALGGTLKESTEAALLGGKIEGYPFSTHALLVEEIGNDEDGNPIDVLFGAWLCSNEVSDSIPQKRNLVCHVIPKSSWKSPVCHSEPFWVRSGHAPKNLS